MLPYIYTTNIFLSFLVLLWPVWFSVRILRLSPINPFTILLACSFPFELFKIVGGPLVLLDEGLFDFGFQFSLLMNTVFIISSSFSLLLWYKASAFISFSTLFPYALYAPNAKNTNLLAVVFLVIFFISFILLATHSFGLFNWIINPRTGYQLHRSGAGHWYAVAVSSLSASFVLFLFSYRSLNKVVFVFIIFLFLVYLMGSKGFFVNLFSSFCIFLWLNHRRYIKRFVYLFAPIIAGTLIYNLSLAYAGNVNYLSVLSYFDYYYNSAIYYNAYFNGKIDLFLGEVFLSNFWSYVPRALYPEKPFVYGVTLVNEFFYPGHAALGHTPAFGGAVKQFADFGVAGVILAGLLNSQALFMAFLSRAFFKTLHREQNSKLTAGGIIIFAVMFDPGYGVYFTGITYVIAVYLLYFTILLFKRHSRF